MKISIIMPTYNDEKTIEKSLDSIMKQTYSNWKLIVIDDGSTDKTKDIIFNYKNRYDVENKIQYIYQENADQLNAILNGMQQIIGDFVYICHSDDLINEPTTFEKCVNYMKTNPSCDAIISNLTLINKNGKEIGTQIVKKYTKRKYILPLQELWLGRNLFVDVAFYRKKLFVSNVKESYLIWNTPFWIKQNKSSLEMVNVNKVEFNLMKYRISQENYINNQIGKLNVIDGELRTLVMLMKYYKIPFYSIQFYLYRLFLCLVLLSWKHILFYTVLFI